MRCRVQCPGILRTAALALLVSGLTASAQTDFLRLKSFGNPLLSAATPWSTPIEGSDGALYGTTYEGGSNDLGTVFRVNKDGTGLTILHSFVGGPADGQQPQGGLVLGTDGALYGATRGGGLSNLGAIFRINKDGTSFAVIKSISTSAEGSGPQGPLCLASDGLLYGTSSSTAFKLNPDGSGFTVLHPFGTGIDGAGPQFGVREASDGLLYGATVAGGSNNLGTIFKLSKDGSVYTVVFNFAGTNGRSPQAPVIEGSNGMLYGTTSYRRTNSYGTLFQLAKDGSSFTTIHDFNGATDGWYPQSALLEGDDGALYGTCTNGGVEAQGMVFKISKSGSTFVDLHDFSWVNADGRVPLVGLLKASDGRLYGTASRGGTGDYGGIFGLDQTGSNYIMLASLSWTGGEGWDPEANLIEASDGSLYGTTCNGGTNEYGTVFRINKDRSGFAVLHHFDRATEGACPKGGLVEGTNGALYGTAIDGGSNSFGTLFRLNKDGGGFVVMHHFSASNGDGSHPQSSLLLGSDDRLYGTTAQGGSNGWGTVYTISQDGSGFAVLRSVPGTNGNEIDPIAALIEGTDGILYGTTAGYNVGDGTVFKIGKDGGGFTNLYQFSAFGGYTNGLVASLVQGTNGALFGTSFSSTNTGNRGFLFEINTDASGFTNLHSFGASRLEGSNPFAGLTLAGNAWLYGTTRYGSTQFGLNGGMLFTIAQDGSGYKVLHSFDAISGGQHPVANLIAGSDGALYGTASTGGDMSGGTVFAVGEPPIFTGINVTPAGALMSIQGISGRDYGIQATTNLNPASWQLLSGVATGTNGLFQYLDASGSNSPAKFYRALTQ